MDKVGRYDFLAEPFHCDFSGRLFMGHLGNHMLNAADFHSSARGFGMKYLMSIQRSWVLSRLAIEMTEMPRQYTKFSVETWVESAMRYFKPLQHSLHPNLPQPYSGRLTGGTGASPVHLRIKAHGLQNPRTPLA